MNEKKYCYYRLVGRSQNSFIWRSPFLCVLTKKNVYKIKSEYEKKSTSKRMEEHTLLCLYVYMYIYLYDIFVHSFCTGFSSQRPNGRLLLESSGVCMCVSACEFFFHSLLFYFVKRIGISVMKMATKATERTSTKMVFTLIYFEHAIL